MESQWEKIYLQTREWPLAKSCWEINAAVCPQWDGKPHFTWLQTKDTEHFVQNNSIISSMKWKSERESQNRWGWRTLLEIARSNSPAYCRCDKSRLLRAISAWGLDIPRCWDCAKSGTVPPVPVFNKFCRIFFFCVCFSVICLISVCVHPLTEKSLAFFLQSLSSGIYAHWKDLSWACSTPGWTLSSLSFSLYDRHSNPFTIFMAPCWTCSSSSMSLVPGRQNCT